MKKATLLEELHEACIEASNQYKDHVTMDEAAAMTWGQELAATAGQTDEVKSAASRHLAFPIRFNTLEEEVNFLSIYHLLMMGSGWDKDLGKAGQRGAAEAAQFAVIGMHIGGQTIDRTFMKAFSPFHVQNYFGITSHVDTPVPELPGVTMSKPGPLHPLVVAIQKVVLEAGEALEQEGSPNLGAHVLGLLDEAKAKGRPPSASSFIEELSTSIPGFADQALCEGRQVQFSRKAQALAGALYLRFKEKDPARFAFTDADQLTVDSGPITPAVLRSKGILVYSHELSTIIDSGEELPSGPYERALRAASVVAADRVVQAASRSFSAFELGCYLGYLADQEDAAGKILPHLTKCSAY